MKRGGLKAVRWWLSFFAFVSILLIACVSPYGRKYQSRIADTYPVILVHGVMGWGRRGMSGFYYWGGTTDLEGELNKRGYDVRTAEVGPISSNWDRACELYAYIKGGRVDYGAAHANRFGHQRYGDWYPGIYPQWGTINTKTGTQNKIHIIGHSLGGQTARLLAHLLTRGDDTESRTEGSSPLFDGGKDWIESITTLSTPHDGSTITEAVDIGNRFFLYIAGLFAAVTESDEFPEYDLHLSQWNLIKQDKESWASFRRRVMDHPMWADPRDLAIWDASVEGAGELNAAVPAEPRIYYFSWAAQNTKSDHHGKWQIPDTGMSPLLRWSARFIGSFTCYEPGKPVIDESWLANDGTVNTCSMDGPTYRSSDRIVAWNGKPERGVWNFMGTIESCDHLDTIGVLSPSPNTNGPIPDIVEWYARHIELLRSLSQ